MKAARFFLAIVGLSISLAACQTSNASRPAIARLVAAGLKPAPVALSRETDAIYGCFAATCKPRVAVILISGSSPSNEILTGETLLRERLVTSALIKRAFQLALASDESTRNVTVSASSADYRNATITTAGTAPLSSGEIVFFRVHIRFVGSRFTGVVAVSPEKAVTVKYSGVQYLE